ncbi:unnamed protein product [marine sediment metagenome]|uniref:Uncharacterized protein n=1 Tax=marine sediment metagenome TaxID=412755 RepID=X1QYY8_9ZZZZ
MFGSILIDCIANLLSHVPVAAYADTFMAAIIIASINKAFIQTFIPI